MSGGSAIIERGIEWFFKDKYVLAINDFTKALATRQSRTTPPESYLIDVGTRQATQLTHAKTEIANHAKADACLTLHATETGSGIHLFTSSLPPAPSARFVAWKIAQGPWVNRSLALAGALNSALLHAGFTVTISRTALIAVDSMACPALAVEVAPARGSDGAVTAEPDDANYQATVATALATALLEWRMEARQP